MQQKALWLLIAALIGINTFTVEVRTYIDIIGIDPSARHSETYLELPARPHIVVAEGERSRIYTGADTGVVVFRNESGWTRLPVTPKRTIHIVFRQTPSEKPQPMLCLLALGSKNRRIILNYPPPSSVWHLPLGVAQLAPLLQARGHGVLQRYGHIAGVEYVLRTQGGPPIERSLHVIRDPPSSISDLHAARMHFEQVSSSIPTNDVFVVERNNVRYTSKDSDGSVAGVLRAIKARESNIWYPYFKEVELPIAMEFRLDIYGISISDEKQFIPCWILASMVKETLPNTLVVLGGNLWPRIKGAYHLPEFAELFDYCDAIIVREGYRPIVELAETLRPSDTSGTVWRDSATIVHINPSTPSPTILEQLPTPVFDGGARQWSPDAVYPLQTMSNCPMHCGFCAISAASDTYLERPRMVSLQRVARHMIALGTHRFDIVDETFLIQRQLTLGTELKRLGYPATWHCYLTITNDLLDQGLCHRLYDAGLRGVQLGLESLSPDTLSRENKTWNTPGNYGRILQNLRAAGIQTHVFIIIGIPGEPLHHGLRWLPFLEQYGDAILTIKAGRYRLTNRSPEEFNNTHSDRIVVEETDPAPLHLNRKFRYCDGTISRKRVEAMRDLLEQACRHHWAYGVTSTVPWWINRGRYTWEELRHMAARIPAQQELDLRKSLPKIRGIIRDELRRDVELDSFEDVLNFSRTL